MRRATIIRSIFAAVAVAAGGAWADTETVNGIMWWYSITDSDGKAIVDGFAVPRPR